MHFSYFGLLGFYTFCQFSLELSLTLRLFLADNLRPCTLLIVSDSLLSCSIIIARELRTLQLIARRSNILSSHGLVRDLDIAHRMVPCDRQFLIFLVWRVSFFFFISIFVHRVFGLCVCVFSCIAFISVHDRCSLIHNSCSYYIFCILIFIDVYFQYI